MINSIDEYLNKLKKELSGCDPDITQDALADSEEHLREALSSAQTIDPDRSESDILQEIIESYGTPDEIAATYKEIEARNGAAMNKKRITIGMVVFISTLFTAVFFLCQGILLLFYDHFHWPGFGNLVFDDSFFIWALMCSALPIVYGIFARHIWIGYRKREKDLPLIMYLIPVFPFLAQGIALLCYWAVTKSEWWDEYAIGPAFIMGILPLSMAFILSITWIVARRQNIICRERADDDK